MLEYSAVLNKGMGRWFEEVSYFLEGVYRSHYFWPGVAAVVVVVILSARALSK